MTDRERRRVPLPEFHQMLWEAADRLGRVKVNQLEWAKKLGIHNSNVSRALVALAEDNRIRRLSHRERGTAVWLISDPDGPGLRERG